MCEICSKLTIKTPERLSGVFIVNNEHTLHLFPDVSVAEFEQAKVCSLRYFILEYWKTLK